VVATQHRFFGVNNGKAEQSVLKPVTGPSASDLPLLKKKKDVGPDGEY
jgi:hypothetical protein